MKHSTASKKVKRQYSKHGLSALKSSISKPAGRVIDGRTKIGRALSEWRRDLVTDLGGQLEVSTQQLAIIDLAVKTKLMLDSIDAWLLQQPSLVNKRRKSVLPVVKERQQLADGLARYMQQLGLERRQKTLDLQEYMRTRKVTQESGSEQS